MFKRTKSILGVAALLAVSTQAHAAIIDVGVAGCCDSGINQWPDGEPPADAIGGTGQKYLNFGEFFTGVMVTPTLAGTTAISMTLTTANDAEERDPASYVLMGISGGTSLDTSAWTLISSGGLALPSTRNGGGAAALDPANQQSISLANSSAYDSYLLYFPTVKNEALANSMQIAEIELFDAAGPIFAPGDTIDGIQIVPEPSAGLLGLLAIGGLGLRRRR